MIISTNELRKDLVDLIKTINAQIEQVEEMAEEVGVEPKKLRDAYGGWCLSPLLLAKAQAYLALTQLNEQEKSKRDRR
jgi:hypothetical protein